MRNVELTIYKYDELSDQAKEYVRSYISEYDYSDYNAILDEDFIDYIKTEYTWIDTDDIKINWSCNHCQGDGLSFKADINIKEYLNLFHPDMKASIHDVICNYVNYFSTGNTGRYNYSNINQIDWEFITYNKPYNRLYNIVDNIRKEIAYKYIELCGILEQRVYDHYEYIQSDEYVKELSDANEYEYYSNGELYNNN